MKVIVYDESYWKNIINFQAFIDNGMIDEKDMKLFDFCNSVDEMFDKIVGYFEKHYLKQIKKQAVLKIVYFKTA